MFLCGSRINGVECTSSPVSPEELRNAHGDLAKILRTGVETTYLCYSNRDDIKAGALTIARKIVKAVKDRD